MSWYDKESRFLRKLQKKRLRLKAHRWLSNGNFDVPEYKFKPSQGWHTW